MRCLLVCLILLSTASSQVQRTDALEKGTALVQSSVADAGRFQPVDNAAVLLLAAHASEKQDRAAVRESLQRAHLLLLPYEDEKMVGLSTLRAEILSALIPLDAQWVSEHLPEDRFVRDSVLFRLTTHTLGQDEFERASSFAKQIQTEPHIYLAAGKLMDFSGVEDSQRSELFANLLIWFRAHSKRNITASYPEDMATILVRHSIKLPPALVREAIDEILRAADPANAPEGSQIQKKRW